MSQKPPRFLLGQVVATPNALKALDASGVAAAELLLRHVQGDWGDVNPVDARANEIALQEGARLMSVYTAGSAIVWIITEYDRSATTLLLSSDY